MYNTIDYALDGETWKPIEGYEGIYEVSDYGRVRSVHGKTTTSTKHGVRTWSGRIIKPKGETYKTGYKVSLWKDKVAKDYLVCRLVGTAFLGAPDDPKMTINHIDGNRFNNHVSNLEWLSLADNIRHAFEHDLIGTNKRVTLLIGDEKHEFMSLSKAGEFIGRNHGYIGRCIRLNKPIKDYSGNVIKIAQ
jgi:hypothetical protein